MTPVSKEQLTCRLVKVLYCSNTRRRRLSFNIVIHESSIQYTSKKSIHPPFKKILVCGRLNVLYTALNWISSNWTKSTVYSTYVDIKNEKNINRWHEYFNKNSWNPILTLNRSMSIWKVRKWFGLMTPERSIVRTTSGKSLMHACNRIGEKIAFPCAAEAEFIDWLWKSLDRYSSAQI